jgi:hypothetical protein
MDASPDHDRLTRAILQSPTYRLAEMDTEFLARPELRPIRLQLELLKPEMAFAEAQVASTIVVFGGTHVVDEPEARQRLQDARAALDAAPDDPARQRSVLRAERILEKAPITRRHGTSGVSSRASANGTGSAISWS